MSQQDVLTSGGLTVQELQEEHDAQVAYAEEQARINLWLGLGIGFTFGVIAISILAITCF